MYADFVLDACRKSWSAGYQTAIDLVWEYAREFAADEETQNAVEQMALLLEAIMPHEP